MLTNQLLIAMPDLADTFFYRGVVYICQHSDEGAIGLLINQPTDYNLQFIFDQLDIHVLMKDVAKRPLLFGGPLAQDRGFVLHRPSDVLGASLLVSDDVSISTSKESLFEMAKGNGPQDVLVALGYAAWGANQLDTEIQDNIWLNCPATPEILYNTSFEQRWDAAIKTIGVDVNKLVSGFGHA